MRPATELVKRARAFQSAISLRVNERIADARSILAVVLLCAAFGTVVDLEVSGDDEDEALAAMTAVFEPDAGETEGRGHRAASM